MRGLLIVGAILSLLVACVPMPAQAEMNYEHNMPTILSLDMVALDATDSGPTGRMLAEFAKLDAIANYEDLSNDRRSNAVELADCGLFGRLRGGGLFSRLRAARQSRWRSRFAAGC